jgi:hypothetical protein
MRPFSTVLIVGLLVASGCVSEAEKQKQAAEAKQKQDDEIDRRAKVIATEMAAKIEQDQDAKRKADDANRQQADEAKHQAEVQHAAEARRKLVQNPAQYFEGASIQLYNKGIVNAYRHVVSLSVTNKSRFPVTDVHGTLDFYDANKEVFASIPLRLAGSIAPGGTMMFNEGQGTLSGGTVQIGKAIASMNFKVTSVKLVGDEGAAAQQ